MLRPLYHEGRKCSSDETDYVRKNNEPRDLVHKEKRRGPRTELWGTPIRRLWGPKAVPRHATCHSKYQGRKLTSCVADPQGSQGRQQKVGVYCVKFCKEIPQDYNGGEKRPLCRVEVLTDCKAGCLCWVASLEARLLRVYELVMSVKMLVKKNTLKGFREIG